MHGTYYIYQADTYCKPCAIGLTELITAERLRGLRPTPDFKESNTWPIGYPTLTSEADYPDHCAGCEELLGLNLTPEGYDYIKEQASHGITDIVAEWIEYYQVELD